MSAGRFAPSPSGDLHLGNLRTAVLAWLWARHTGRDFVLRIEDLDRVRAGAEARQLADLAALGLTWDGPVVRQSERRDLYAAAVARLESEGLTYRCYCTRREIAEAAAAPHGPPGAYPGTCRDRREPAPDRPPAIRLRAAEPEATVHDELHVDVTGAVDDVVLVRTDGVPAYNLAVVVDDAAQGVDQVVRGDDLLDSAPRQAYLAGLLDLPVPTYVHVPLALNVNGARLAKRDGAVTSADLRARSLDPFALIVDSLGLPAAEIPDLAALLAQFEPDALPREPWVFRPPA